MVYKRQQDIFKRIQKEILIPELNKLFASRGKLAELALRMESDFKMAFAKNRLSELRSGKRALTFFFAHLMIKGGIMTVDQILRGRKLADVEPVERELILRLEADLEALELLHEAKEQGIDGKAILRLTIKRP